MNHDKIRTHNDLTSGKLTELWKITIFNGNTHYKWPFSIAMAILVITRG